MITKKNLKYRKQKFKSNKVNHLNKNKIMKGGKLSLMFLFNLVETIVINVTGYFLNTRLDIYDIENLNNIRTKINEQYINFLDSSDEYKLDTKITDSEYYKNNPKNTFETLSNYNWLNTTLLNQGKDDINYNLYLVDLDGETKKETFIIPPNICVVLLSVTNNLPQTKVNDNDIIFNSIIRNYKNFFNKRSSYHLNFDEYDNVMKMATWYYPSQKCFDINLKTNNHNSMYILENNERYVEKFSRYSHNTLENIVKDISSDYFYKNNIVFISSSRLSNSFDDEYNQSFFHLDYINRITNYSIEYYISKCNGDYKTYNSDNLDTDVINFIKAKNRTLKPETEDEPTLIRNISYPKYLYFQKNKNLKDYIKSKTLINTNLSSNIPYLYYFGNKLVDMNEDASKLDNKYTFDHSIFTTISLTKQVKFIEEIINRITINGIPNFSNQNDFVSPSVFIKFISKCGINFVNMLSKEEYLIKFDNSNYLDEIDTKNMLFRDKDFTNSYAHYHFKQIGKLLIYYSMEHNKKSSPIFEQLRSIGLLEELSEDNNPLEILINTDSEFENFKTNVAGKKNKVYNLTVTDIPKSVMIESDFIKLKKLRIINIQQIKIQHLPKLEYLRLEKIKDNSWSEILSANKFPNLTKLELISLQINSDVIISCNSLNYLCIEDIKNDKKINCSINSVKYLFLINLKSDIQFLNFNFNLTTELHIDNVDCFKTKTKELNKLFSSKILKRLTILNMDFKNKLQLKELSIYNLEIRNCRNIKIDNISNFSNIRNLILYDSFDLELESNLFNKNKNLIVEYRNIKFITDKKKYNSSSPSFTRPAFSNTNRFLIRRGQNTGQLKKEISRLEEFFGNG